MMASLFVLKLNSKFHEDLVRQLFENRIPILRVYEYSIPVGIGTALFLR